MSQRDGARSDAVQAKHHATCCNLIKCNPVHVMQTAWFPASRRSPDRSPANPVPMPAPALEDDPAQRPLLLAAIASDDLRLQILEGLTDFGWRVLTASTGKEIPGLVSQHSPDVLVVDPDMADRAAGNIRSLPMLRVALVPPGETEKCMVLLRAIKINVCLTFPVAFELLAASLDGLLRLSKPDAEDQDGLTKSRLGESIAAWSLSSTTWMLTPPGLPPLQLTQAETTFLATLAQNPGIPVPRPQMIAALGHNIDYYDSRRLDTLVSRLRVKISRSGAVLPIRSIHSVGYAFVAAIMLED